MSSLTLRSFANLPYWRESERASARVVVKGRVLHQKSVGHALDSGELTKKTRRDAKRSNRGTTFTLTHNVVGSCLLNDSIKFARKLAFDTARASSKPAAA